MPRRRRQTTALTPTVRGAAFGRLASRQSLVGWRVRQDRVQAARRRPSPPGLPRCEPDRDERWCDSGRTPSSAVPPFIVTRSGWNADESIRQSPPAVRGLAPICGDPPHSRRERLHTGRGACRRPRDRALPRQGQRLERHRLQLSRRSLRHGVRGALRRRRQERGRSARARVQPWLCRDRDDRHVHRPPPSPAAMDALARLLAWRSISRTSTPCPRSR